MRSRVETASLASLFRTKIERDSRDWFSLGEIVFLISFLTAGNPSLEALDNRVDWFSPKSLEIAPHVLPDR